MSLDEDTVPVLITNTSFNIEMFSGRVFHIASELELKYSNIASTPIINSKIIDCSYLGVPL